MYTLIDCYTDEPAGLGVPPYLGVYPRYIYGYLSSQGEEINYLTIDDLRNLKKEVRRKNADLITDITTYNLTRSKKESEEILKKSNVLIIIVGVHTPGKYLSATAGTIKEISGLVDGIKASKILTGPAFYGTQNEGGKFFEKNDMKNFDELENYNFKYSEIKDYSLKGVDLLKQIPDARVIEIETARGCSRSSHCSFCTEPLKSKYEFREKEDVLNEVKKFYEAGARYFRIGKQSCFYAYPYASELLKEISGSCPEIKVLHIDNVDPANVLKENGEQITQDIVKYCTAGNIAAFGVESFDPEVGKCNNLNSTPEQVYEAVKILNKYGAERGENGMHKFLPGINLLYGLIGESKETNNHNLKWLKKIMDEGLLLRRINIRQVSIFEGTPLYKKAGNKFVKKNKKYYYKWREEIRQQIDLPMLKKLMPAGTIMKDCYSEIHDGNTTFLRQFGTYPLIIGVKARLPLKQFYNVKVKDYMLRSLVGEVEEK